MTGICRQEDGVLITNEQPTNNQRLPAVRLRVTRKKKGKSMAQFETIDAIEKLTGKMSRTDCTVMRQKKFKINGKIVGLGPKEAFNKEKRDFRRKPRRGAEAAQNERWTNSPVVKPRRSFMMSTTSDTRNCTTDGKHK